MIDIQLRKVEGGEWGQSTFNSGKLREGRAGMGGGRSMVNLERIRKDFARITSDNVDWGQLMVNLERIHEDFARITCDNVYPGGSIDG